MTDPTPPAVPAAPAADLLVLDQEVINAGRALLDAMTADPADPDAIETARERMKAARRTRWGHG